MRPTALLVLVFAIVYGLVLVWGGEALFAASTTRQFTMGTEVGPRWTRTVLAALPFGLFALYLLVRGAALSTSAMRRGWLTGIALSLLFWSWYFIDPFFYDGGGANIGLGLVMMASPLPIFLVMWWLARRRSD